MAESAVEVRGIAPQIARARPESPSRRYYDGQGSGRVVAVCLDHSVRRVDEITRLVLEIGRDDDEPLADIQPVDR